MGQHGVFIYGQETEIKYNIVRGTFLAFVIKSAGLSYPSVLSYNIIEECSAAFTIKGSPDTTIYNNTFVNDTINGAQFLQLQADELFVGSYSINLLFKNNIQVSNDNYNGIFLSATTNDVVGATFDNNIYYKNNGGTDFAVFNSPGKKTFVEWQALGFDLNSSIQNPQLTDNVPSASSVAIGNGEDLGASFNDGLDASTNWGNNETLPVVVTKQQNTNWDIGAYIK